MKTKYASLLPTVSFLFCFLINFSPISTCSANSVTKSVSPSDTASIQVNLNQKLGPMNPMWANFGYDEADYTFMKDGKKLLTELSKLSPVPVNIRVHYLLATGNGVPRPKWSSTNAYTENSKGQPVYNWKIVDKIFDTFVHRGIHPFVEIGFMPKALSTHPNPYEPTWSPKPPHGKEMTGYTYPPKSYTKWADLISHWVRHCIKRYGKKQVESWYWEVWNEPDISYWHGTKQQYFKLYDYTVNAVKKALPDAIVGGPATTSPRNNHAAQFLKDFLKHCSTGKNYVTGKTGAPLDFISFHAKGSPKVVNGHVQMGMSYELRDVTRGFQIVSHSSHFSKLPIVISEADPEGCAGCSSQYYPHNDYRNGTMYSSYTADMFSRIYALADEYHVNLKGALSWSFEFENQPWFAGFRALATHGVDKPVLNVFRMFGMMRGDRVHVQSDQSIGTVQVIENGVHDGVPDINGMASKTGHSASVLVWNYYGVTVPGKASNIKISVKGIPAKKVLLHQYRIDKTHSNSYTLWKQMGSPQHVTKAQYAKLEQAGQLHILTSPEWLHVSNNGTATIRISLPRRGVSLLQLTW